MKNITKKLISVLTLVVIFSVIGANVSLAAISKTSSLGSVSKSSSSKSSNGGGSSGSQKAFTVPTIVSATVITGSTTATLDGSVNANGESTNVWFETPSDGPFQTQNIGNGTSAFDLLPYTLTGLTPNTSYSFRIVASNINGITNGSWVVFSTTSASQINAPTIVSTTISNVSSTSATFEGYVNPNGSNTLAWFETAANGPFQIQNIGSGTSAFNLLPYTITGLTSNTTYKFRIVSSNINGITNGNWVTFTTLAIGSQCTTPTISSISPNYVTAGAGTTIVTVTGSNFINGTSSAEIDGSARTTNVSNSTSLTMTLTASDVSSPDSKDITVTNGSGCESNAIIFTINSTGGGGGGGGGGGSYQYASVITLNSTSISANSAILNGTIDPNGHTTTAWFEYGTSSNLSTVNETIHVNQGSGTSPSALAQSISGLNPSTTYYFRAVANNTYGTVKGYIYSFTTAVRNGNVTTVQATSQSANSAKLNGLFINPNGTSAIGYFEYGKTASLGTKTADKDLGTSSSTSFSNFITGLTPNTIYFFRAVVKNQGTINNGNILVFKTSKATAIQPPVIITTEPTVVTTESSILKITNEKDEVAIGDEVNYLVSFKNTDSKNFENAKLSVQLPKEIDFVDSNFGKFNSDNDLVEFNPEILLVDQVGSITIKGKVNSKAEDNNILITTAVMSYNLEGSTETKDEIAYATNHVIAGIGLEANPLFGTNFLPSTLLGWLALILVVLGLAIIGKNLYSNYAVKNSGRKISNDIDNLPM